MQDIICDECDGFGLIKPHEPSEMSPKGGIEVGVVYILIIDHKTEKLSLHLSSVLSFSVPLQM